MPQMYKVFFNNRTLFLVSETEVLNEKMENIHHHTNQSELNDFILKFNRNTAFINGCITFKNGNDAMEIVKPLFKYIEAAGGIVENHQQQLLLIHRLGCWDLPKGKCEPGETPEQTAIREIKEECNITVDEICHKIIDTYHTYELKGKLVLKKTYWYKMKTNGDQIPVPQEDESISIAQWMDVPQLAEIKRHTYPSILDVLKAEGI